MINVDEIRSIKDAIRNGYSSTQELGTYQCLSTLVFAHDGLEAENAKLKEALRVFKKLSDEMQADAERQQVFDLLGQELWMEI